MCFFWDQLMIFWPADYNGNHVKIPKEQIGLICRVSDILKITSETYLGKGIRIGLEDNGF